jgi:hypothetical protein
MNALNIGESLKNPINNAICRSLSRFQKCRRAVRREMDAGDQAAA